MLCVLNIGFAIPLGYILYWYSIPNKYTMAIYHFNTQFVPGNVDIERYIINQSIRAILEMYLRHPSWKFNLELSGSGLELMNNSYPEVFQMLNTCVSTGQCELILSPYSEMLSIAFPSYDMAKAINFSIQVANALHIKRSSVLFLQENQFHPAFPLLRQFGYDIFVVSGDTFHYYGIPWQYPLQNWSFYGESIDLVVYPSDLIFGTPQIRGNIQYYFRWHQDGEAANTNSQSGAGPEAFVVDPTKQKMHEKRAQNLEKLGYRFLTITEWVNLCKSRGEPFYHPLETFLPDATWSMYETHGPMMWMGYNWENYGINGSENDGYYRALNYRTRNLLLAVETLYNHYRGSLVEEAKIIENLTEAWKHQILAEVSDSTGWHPLPEEWEYTIYHSSLAKNFCDAIIKHIKLNTSISQFQVFTHNKTIRTNLTEFVDPIETIIPETALPTGFHIFINGTTYSSHFFNVTWGEFTYYKIKLNITPSTNFKIQIKFDTLIHNISYSPSLAENTSIQLSPVYPNPVYLSLSNGFIYANGFGIIKNCSAHHTGLVWNQGKLYFEERNQSHYIQPEFILTTYPINKALFLANLINTYPCLKL
ncbi:MAG: hypothetical protein ACTSYB_03660 [Candidatus Helarchaeota archaeon]